MRYFTVKEIAEKLEVNPETVRRWLRRRELWGRYSSKRAGFVVNSEELERFLSTKTGARYRNRLKKEKENKKEKEDTVFAVTYCRIEAGITDMRYFSSIEDLADWFDRQVELEPTIIIGIREGL